MSINKRFKEIRSNLGLSQAKFAKSIGLTQSKVADIEIEKGRVSPEIAKKIEDIYKANIRWLLFAEGNPFDTEVNEQFTAIPERGDIEASAGTGCFINNENPTSYISFENKLLKQLSANNSECDVLTVKGDSMTPTLATGDKILVDKSKREVLDGRIYILRVENTLYVKRLQKLPKGKLRVISDNKEFESFELIPNEDDFDICGRVLWSSRAFI